MKTPVKRRQQAEKDPIKLFTALVENIEAERQKKLIAVGKQARKFVLPHFRENRLTFMAGNGDWFINDTKGNFIDDDELPAEIRGLLWIEVGRSDYVGYYVEDIKPADWKVK